MTNNTPWEVTDENNDNKYSVVRRGVVNSEIEDLQCGNPKDAKLIVEAVNNHAIYKKKAEMFDEFMPEVDKMIKEAYELDAKLDVFNAKDRDSLSLISIVLQNLQAFRDKAKQLTKESE